MSKLYVLELKGGKYYVGKTDDPSRRYEEHKSGKGSEWTKLHKPVKMLETRQIKSSEDETAVTKELMKKHGVDNVRGGAFCQRELPSYVKKTLELEQRGNTDSCFKCGKKGHFAKDCSYEEYEEEYEEDDEDEEDDPNTCYRCQRFGHWANQCYAKTDKYGNQLDDSDSESDDE